MEHEFECICDDCINKPFNFLDSVIKSDFNDERNHILFIVPDSAGDVFLSTALLPSIRELFPDKKIFFSTRPHNFKILKNNPHIAYTIPFNKNYIYNVLYMQGVSDCVKFFDIIYTPTVLTQIFENYQYNGLKAHNLEFKNNAFDRDWETPCIYNTLYI